MIEHDIGRLTVSAVENCGDFAGTTQAAARTLALVVTRVRANLKRGTHVVHSCDGRLKDARRDQCASTLQNLFAPTARLTLIDIQRAHRILITNTPDGLGQ